MTQAITKKTKKSISLVLGSGGARGYAHIGVIEVLEEHGYEIKSIVGSSMGALVGALYACDKLDAYKEWVLTLDKINVAKLLDFSFGKLGIIKGNKVFDVIEKMIGDITIQDLPISYTAVATDISNQKEVWLQKGRLLDAVRASIAIPTIFTPVTFKNRLLIDGGVLNPLPIAPTIADITDLTVAVKLDSTHHSKTYTIDLPRKEREKQKGIQRIFFELYEKTESWLTKEEEEDDKNEQLGLFDIVGKALDTMQSALTQCKMAGYAPDIIIDIPGDACGFYEFNRAYEMIELGRLIATETLSNFETKKYEPFFNNHQPPL